MKNIFKNTSILMLFISIISCDQYLDVNESIDNKNLDQINPEQLLVGTQTASAETYTTQLNRVGNFMAVAWSGNYNAFNNPLAEESTYLFSSTFYEEIWDETYQNTNNFTIIENYNDGNDWSNHKAIAKILKAFYLQYIVDLYGDAPYTGIHKGTNNLFPKYDDGESIYKNLIGLIDNAQDLLNNNSRPVNNDITFKGDLSKWNTFANTIKLRLLVRLIPLAETKAELKTYIDARFAELNTAQFVSEDVTVNAGYSNSDDRQNPFYEFFGANPAGVATDDGREIGPSKFAFELLENSGDPRLNRLWKDNGVFQGTEQNGSGNAAAIGDGILKEATSDLPIMLAAESYFLQAEAVHRGYLTGDAQALFVNGITTSFTTLGAGDPTAYIAANTANADLGFTTDPLRAIITQKWIALTSVSGGELWIEYNRTGYPSNIPTPNGLDVSNIPVRLLYPASEYSGNSQNVIDQQRGDAFTSKIFWDVN